MHLFGLQRCHPGQIAAVDLVSRTLECVESATAADCPRAVESQCLREETTTGGHEAEDGDGDPPKSFVVGFSFYLIIFIVLLILFGCM